MNVYLTETEIGWVLAALAAASDTRKEMLLNSSAYHPEEIADWQRELAIWQRLEIDLWQRTQGHL